MQISSLAQIIDAKIQSEPSVSFVYDIKTKASLVKEGDAFASNNLQEIQKAISKGAFCVIYSNKNIEICDFEIAWLFVDDLQNSLLKIVRFLFANLKLKAFFCEKLTFEMLQIFRKKSKKILFLDDNIAKNFEQIKSIDNQSFVLCANEELICKIYPMAKKLKSVHYKLKNVTEHSLFEVSFTYRDFYINRLKLPIIYVRNFLDAWNFYGFEELDLVRLKKFKHLNPYFINKNFQIVDFGKSDKFIISQNDKSSMILEMNFLASRFTYGKKIFLLPKNLNHLASDDTIFYSSKEEIKEIINTKHYNCLYIFGIGEEKIENFLVQNYFTKPLF